MPIRHGFDSKVSSWCWISVDWLCNLDTHRMEIKCACWPGGLFIHSFIHFFILSFIDTFVYLYLFCILLKLWHYCFNPIWYIIMCHIYDNIVPAYFVKSIIYQYLYCHILHIFVIQTRNEDPFQSLLSWLILYQSVRWCSQVNFKIISFSPCTHKRHSIVCCWRQGIRCL